MGRDGAPRPLPARFRAVAAAGIVCHDPGIVSCQGFVGELDIVDSTRSSSDGATPKRGLGGDPRCPQRHRGEGTVPYHHPTDRVHPRQPRQRLGPSGRRSRPWMRGCPAVKVSPLVGDRSSGKPDMHGHRRAVNTNIRFARAPPHRVKTRLRGA